MCRSNRWRSLFFSLALSLILLAQIGVGCAPQAVPPERASGEPAEKMGLEEQAAAEATAIIERARATALVMQAQAEATAVMAQAATAQPDVSILDPGGAEGMTLVKGTPLPAVDEEEYRVEIHDVGFAAEGGFIMVRFHATRKAADDFWPGRLSITDEATGTVYNEVPVMPVVGVMIGRPRNFQQLGHIMFVNKPLGLAPGALVTVQLSQFKQEHVQVNEQ